MTVGVSEAARGDHLVEAGMSWQAWELRTAMSWSARKMHALVVEGEHGRLGVGPIVQVQVQARSRAAEGEGARRACDRCSRTPEAMRRRTALKTRSAPGLRELRVSVRPYPRQACVDRAAHRPLRWGWSALTDISDGPAWQYQQLQAELLLRRRILPSFLLTLLLLTVCQLFHSSLVGGGIVQHELRGAELYDQGRRRLGRIVRPLPNRHRSRLMEQAASIKARERLLGSSQVATKRSNLRAGRLFREHRRSQSP